jgi:tetratricopeptide (TPR) repeat protein
MKRPKLRDYETLSRQIYAELARNPQKALKAAERGVALAKKEKSGIGLARMILSRAHAFREIGAYRKALKNYDLAASAFRRQGEKNEAARTVIGKMDALDQLGRYKEALQIASAARRAFHRTPELKARLDANTGNIYHRLGKYSSALKYYDLARHVLARERPLDGYVILFNQATIYLCQGNPQAAVNPLNSCISYFEDNQFSSFLGRTHYNLAYAYYLLGKYQNSLAHISTARSLFGKLRDHSFLASCFLDESELYLRLNRIEESIQMAQRAGKKFAKLKMPYELAETNVMLGIALLRKHRISDAIHSLKGAHYYFRRSGNKVKSAELNVQIAHAFVKAGKGKKAMVHLQKAYAVFAKQRMYARMLSSITYQARLLVENESLAVAAQILEKARGWIHKVTLPWILSPYYHLLGKIESMLGRSTAKQHLKKAIRLIEGMRAEIPAEDLRISYLHDKMKVYDVLIDLELGQGDSRGWGEAFQYSERARSRVLLDLLEGSLTFEKDPEKSLPLHLELEQLKTDSWNRSIGGTSKSSEARERRILQILRKMQISRGPLAFEKISFSGIQSRLAPDEALISFYWTESRLNAFVFHRKGMKAYSKIADSEKLYKVFQLLRFQIERKSQDTLAQVSHCEPHLESLHSGLVAPLYPVLQDFGTWDDYSAQMAAQSSIPLFEE